MVDKHLGPSIGPKQLSRLTPRDIEVMLNAKVAPKGKSAALSARTAHHIRAALRNALRMAERDSLVSRNVAALDLFIASARGLHLTAIDHPQLARMRAARTTRTPNSLTA